MILGSRHFNRHEGYASEIWDEKLLHDIIPDLPAFDLMHIYRLTNQVGILQHAKYSTPNYHHGYCLDDNARALLLVVMAHEKKPSVHLEQLISTYLAYLYYMQLGNGKFRNFLSFDHVFLDEEGTEDSFGRTIWGLGYLLKTSQQAQFHPLVQELFRPALRHINTLRSLRAVAYSLLGLMYYATSYPKDEEVQEIIEQMAHYMLDEYQKASSPDWTWYEKIVSYDNAILPLSILRAACTLQDNTLLDVGRQSAYFLDSLYFEREHLSVIGNESWFIQGSTRSRFGQQPIELPSTILLYKQLYEITGEEKYLDKMLTSFRWFFGANELGLSLYDPQSKGCCDGLDSHGINRNQGAESTISFWLSYLYSCYGFC